MIRFGLHFGADGWPGHGYAAPSGLPNDVNLIVPVDAVDHFDELRASGVLCPAPEGESGQWVAVTAKVDELRAALDELYGRGLRRV